ncbi:MAG: hypothetical protein OXU21_11365 [Chloroflexota bacterium]|nr:hypothetical protein [Chloroflexota bacterium]
MRKWFVVAIVTLLVAGAVTSVQAIGCDAHEGTPIDGGCLYTITGGDTPDPNDGFPVANTGGINWYSCVRTLGLQDVGYPIAQQFEFNGFQILALQKVMLQYRPDYANRGGCSQFAYLNSMDILANSFNNTNLPGVPAHRVLPEDEGASFAQIVQNHLRLLDANPVLRAKFLEKSNWQNLYGLPIAYEEQEINGNPQGAQVLRAQRAVWRIFNVDAPGTRRGVPHLLNVPDQIKRLNGIIIPQWAKRPVSAAQASGMVPAPMALPHGLQGYGMQGEFRRADDQQLANLVTGAGFGWVKQQVPWEEVETPSTFGPNCEPGDPSIWYWADVDRFVNTMRANGLNILLSVVKAPPCYKEPGSPPGHGPPVDPATFGRFMQAIASRYKGRVQAYELWNEANLQREWTTLRPTDPNNNAHLEFLELVKHGYSGGKRGDPNAYMGLGAPTPAGNTLHAIDDRQYLQRLWAANGGEIANYFEFLGVHPNGGPNAPDDTINNPSASRAKCNGGWSTHDSFFFSRYEQLYADMIAAGPAFRDKTLWLTEFGWATTSNPASGYEYAACNTEQDQANYFVRAFAKVRAEAPYVTHMIVWNLNFQQVVGAHDEKWAFGIVRSDLSPRPAYTALRNMPKPVAAPTAPPPAG